MVPEGVARPTSAEEVAALLAEAAATGTPVTCAGGQTSTTGASITDRGIVLSLRAMDRVLDLDPVARTVRVEPGVFVGELKRACAVHGLLLAPDPTSEEECTVGGAVACNASGARSLRYGATRPHVRALRVAARGRLDRRAAPSRAREEHRRLRARARPGGLVRGQRRHARRRRRGRAGAAAASGGSRRAGDPVRHRAGRAGVRRRGAPEHRTCIRAASSSSTVARSRSRARRSRRRTGRPTRRRSCTSRRFHRAAPRPHSTSGWRSPSEHRALTDDVNVYEGESALREARRVRHAVPATMNERGSLRRPHGGRKVSTDWAVPYARLGEMLAQARARSPTSPASSRPVTYGHAGNGHPHQNFIAHDGDAAQADRGRGRGDAARGDRDGRHRGGGARHREDQAPLAADADDAARRCARCAAVKRELDPAGILAPGNVL